MKKHLLTLFTLLPSLVLAMVPLEDSEMAEVTGQSLLVADYIAPSGSTNSETDFHYYRMGLDALVEMNVNIDKLQLGCGGYNEAVRPDSCDIDLDYVSFLGRYDGSGNNPNQGYMEGDKYIGAGKAGDPVTSDFKLTRPYFEIAVRDIGGGQREIAGFKIGAQEADGFMGIGRKYNNGDWNEEHQVTCNPSNPITCHSGINTLSGFLNVEVSADVPLTVITVFSGSGCFGRTSESLNTDCANNSPFVVEQSGTRLDALEINDIVLDIDLGWISSIPFLSLDTAYARVDQSLRFIHGFAANQTSDFFISFQREPVKYPSYDKNSHSSTANTGWWLNIPSIEVLDLQGEEVSIGIDRVFSALSSPGLPLKDLELNTVPPKNCYGSYTFC